MIGTFSRGTNCSSAQARSSARPAAGGVQEPLREEHAAEAQDVERRYQREQEEHGGDQGHRVTPCDETPDRETGSDHEHRDAGERVRVEQRFRRREGAVTVVVGKPVGRAEQPQGGDQQPDAGGDARGDPLSVQRVVEGRKHRHVAEGAEKPQPEQEIGAEQRERPGPHVAGPAPVAARKPVRGTERQVDGGQHERERNRAFLRQQARDEAGQGPRFPSPGVW
jgi:hypothetical protein